MKKFPKKQILTTALLLLLWGCGTSEPSKESGDLEPLVVQLHWIPDTHQIGFWIALDKGFYASRGLEVEIRAGGLDASPIKDVVGGAADIGQIGGIEQAIVAASEELPLTTLAAIHRETPHALISLSENPITNPTEFYGKKIAVAFGDTAEILLKSYMDKAEIRLDDVELVPFRYDLTGLLNGQVDAITGFATGQPALLESMGQAPVVLSYKSAGVSSYGYTLVSSNDKVNSNPSAIQAFLAASRDGWSYAFANQKESIGLLTERFNSIDPELAAIELKLIEKLMLTEDGLLSEWQLDEDRIASVISYLHDNEMLKKPVSVDKVINYTIEK